MQHKKPTYSTNFHMFLCNKCNDLQRHIVSKPTRLQSIVKTLYSLIRWAFLYSACGDTEPLLSVAPTGCTKSDPGKRQTWSMGRMIPKGRKQMSHCHCVHHKPHIITQNNPDLYGMKLVTYCHSYDTDICVASYKTNWEWL